MPKHYKVTPSRFFCTRCGKEGIPIQRKKGQERSSKHLKNLYCLYCGTECNHAEIRYGDTHYTIEDFKEEFELGRFVDGQRIEIKDLKSCENLECPYNKNGKCWNANHSYQCAERGDKNE